MNDTIKSIEVNFYDKENSLQLASDIYTTYVKPLEDTLSAAKERERRLVEALGKCVPILEAAGEFFNGVTGGLDQARAALALMKVEA